MPAPDPGVVTATREAWHLLAEHVLAAARYRAERRIGLVAAPGGFATRLPDGSSIAVVGREVETRDRRERITTGGAAAALAGTEFGLPDGIYPIETPRDPDLPLSVDARAATFIAAWFAFGDRALRSLISRRGAGETATLWPEHFDLGVDLGEGARRATFGASPGDAAHPEPYLYVTPWTERSGAFWNDGTYASLSYSELVSRDDPHATATAFFDAALAVMRQEDLG